MRVKRQRTKSDTFAAATTVRPELSSTQSSAHSNFSKTETASNSIQPVDSSHTLQRLKEHKHNSTLRAAMQAFQAGEPSNDYQTLNHNSGRMDGKTGTNVENTASIQLRKARKLPYPFRTRKGQLSKFSALDTRVMKYEQYPISEAHEIFEQDELWRIMALLKDIHDEAADLEKSKNTSPEDASLFAKFKQAVEDESKAVDNIFTTSFHNVGAAPMPGDPEEGQQWGAKYLDSDEGKDKTNKHPGFKKLGKGQYQRLDPRARFQDIESDDDDW